MEYDASKKDLEIKKFSWEELKIVHVRKNHNRRFQSRYIDMKIRDNSERWIHFVIGVVVTYEPRPPEGQKWCALCIHMNQKNIDALREMIDEFVWLDIAPKLCSELADDEYGVDPTNIVEGQP